MPRMLISGGNGFLGSFLAEQAIKEGIEVVVVDDFSTSSEINVPDEVRLVREKIEDHDDESRYEYVVHLAARPSPEDYITNPISTLLSNSIGTKKMLDIALRSNAVFLYTSSSEVYGEAAIIPTPESYYGYVNPNGPRSCYDEGKRYSEALIMAYHRQYGLNVRIQRPFNVYGPRIRPDGQYGRVIPRFIAQALKGEPITIHGDGLQTRSFLYVDDWVRATWSMLTRDNISGHVFNIGSPDQISVAKLAQTIRELTNSNSRLEITERREDDPTRRAADITKAKSMLGWEPVVGLNQGLQETIEWLRGKIQ